jgi:hypothetical protein
MALNPAKMKLRAKIVGYNLLCLLITAYGFLSCGPKKSSSENIPVSTPLESASNASDATPKQFNDSSSYINFVYSFDHSDEIYLPLFSRTDNITSDHYENLRQQLDSVIFSDDDIKRSRLPLSVALQNFTLEGLDRIALYDKQSHFIGQGRMLRVEYFEDLMEGQFVAVYEKPHSFKEGYGIGNHELIEREPAFGYSIVEDSLIDKRITQFLGLKYSRELNVNHFKLKETIYSYLSMDTTAYICKWNGVNLARVYQSEQSSTIYELIPLPLMIENHPIMLAKFSIPETDMSWNALLIFKDGEFLFAPRNRIKL